MMKQCLSTFRIGRLSLPALALILAITAGFGLGYRAALGRSQDQSAQGNRAVSEKSWLTAQQLQNRFPIPKHEEFMRRAIENSRMAGVERRTGGAFGAVIVDREGNIIGEGSNHVAVTNDSTWHGEMEAIRMAAARAKKIKLDGCILYTSSEPCPMCLATAYWAGLDGLFYGALAEDSKKYGGFDDSFIYEECAKPRAARNLPEIMLLRDEAVKVWKEYAALPNNVPY
jgi:tRNA(Arg) A34 adenosine deaminase TadA